MKVGSLFSGIGGFDLGLEWAGMEVVWQVENDPFCLKVLHKHWPEVPKYGDIKELNAENLAEVDVIVGGFPCQSFSTAGKRRGKGDDRYLWPEMFRIIQELRPTWVIGENVTGIIRLALDTVLSDLEGENYSTRTFNIPACSLDAPHRRERVWIVGNSEGDRNQKQRSTHTRKNTAWEERAKFFDEPSGENVADSTISRTMWGKRTQADASGQDGGGRGSRDVQWWQAEPAVGRVADGVPNRMDRIKGLGNAVVPQIPYIFGCYIQELNSSTTEGGSENEQTDDASTFF